MNDCFMFENARKVYESLGDEISRKVFEARCLYSMTGNMDHIIGLNPQYRNLSSDIESFYKSIKPGRYTFIYGAGIIGKVLAQEFSFLNIQAFIDEFRKDEIDEEVNIPIVNIERFGKEWGNLFNECKIIVAIGNPDVAKSVKADLVKRIGFPENRITLCVSDWRNNTSQYFDFFEPRLNEVFVDCGCFDGGTCFRFAGWCGKVGFDKIISFEPDEKSYQKCVEILSPLKNCEVFPYGISNASGKVYFETSGREDAHIISEKEALAKDMVNVEKIETVKLDEFLKNEKVTFIKMDIEGAEYDALLGASNIIKERKPRLAISVYHVANDFIRIPLLLKELNPEYKLYLRQYSLLSNETILYAE